MKWQRAIFPTVLLLAIMMLGAACTAAGLPTPQQPAGVSAPPAEATSVEGEPAAAETMAEDEKAALTPVCDGTLTPRQAEGPYYTPNTPERADLVEPGIPGTPLLVTGSVLDQNCEPIAGAMVDFWQTDGEGQYDNVGYQLRGHQFTDEDGRYHLETVIPGVYPGRTPHIHVKIFGPDGSELLTTQLYLRGLSEEVPDSIYQPELLARDMEAGADGRRQVAFDFVVDG